MTTMTRVIIASKSPRRREILSSKFKNISILELEGPDEPRWVKGQDPDEYLTLCVNFKAELAKKAVFQQKKAFFGFDSKNSFVVVADTIVQWKKQVFGKPQNSKDALSILQRLSGSTHLVKTKVKVLVYNCNADLMDTLEFCSISAVDFKKLSFEEINSYIKTKEPFDKAGAYGLQDKALKFVKNIRGSYLNIVGFPLNDFVSEIQNYNDRTSK